MKPDNPIKHFVLPFVLALIGYAISYRAIEHRRARSGPWQVAFTNDAAGAPAILINQPKLAITHVEIRFPGEALPVKNARGDSATNHSWLPVNDRSWFTNWIFTQPRQVPYDVPFGQCIFMDTTFLPGTLTLRLFGHELELLPRVLLVDHLEHPWRSDTTITLQRAEHSPTPSKR
jgi:hypothetical protein